MSLTRDWKEYAIKTTFAESAERPWPQLNPLAIEEYKKNIKKGFEGHIYKLPHPIICVSPQIKDILDLEIETKRVRIYPPFEINILKEISSAFEGVVIPEGNIKLEDFKPIPNSAVNSFHLEQHSSARQEYYCQGLRIDVEIGAPINKIINILLEQICQYTHQWWLRSGISPFNGMKRFGFSIGNNFEIIKELRYHGAGNVESSWHAVRQTQLQLGIELPLDSQKWLLIGNHVAHLRPAEAGFIAFYDAIASYMAEEDEQCILNLSLCVEILGNRRRLLLNQSDIKADELLTTTDLVDDNIKAVLKKLFIDRGHVAHGRPAHVLTTDSTFTIERYIEAVRAFLSGYNQKLKPEDWITSSSLEIGKSRKKNNTSGGESGRK